MRGSNGAVRYGTLRYGAVRCRDTVRYGAAGNQPCGAVSRYGYGYGAVRFRDTVRCSHLRPGYAVRLRYSPNAVRDAPAVMPSHIYMYYTNIESDEEVNDFIHYYTPPGYRVLKFDTGRAEFEKI